MKLVTIVVIHLHHQPANEICVHFFATIFYSAIVFGMCELI